MFETAYNANPNDLPLHNSNINTIENNTKHNDSIIIHIILCSAKSYKYTKNICYIIFINKTKYINPVKFTELEENKGRES